MMDEFESGKNVFLGMVHQLDPAIEVVIPVAPSNSLFLISLTKGPNRKFLTVHEDDMLDLPNEADIQSKVQTLITQTMEQQ